MTSALRSLAVILLVPACAPALDGGVPSSSEHAIVNGFATDISSHPWQVTLDGFCGGSIINSSWILTAQHCVEGLSAGEFNVFAGITYLSDAENAQYSGVAQIVRNPGYQSPEVGNDAALLRLTDPFVLGGDVQAIDLVTPEDAAAGATAPGVVATVSGWGTTQSGGFQTPDQLRAVDVVIRSLDDAESFYGALTDDQLAAGGDGADSCQGDSGGPLTVETSHGTALAGIVSWGGGCGDGYPGMYGRVSAFASWITSTLSGAPPTDDPADGWMCDPSWNGDGECDCGCGATDADCPGATLQDCQYNHCDLWQAQQGLNVDPEEPAQCSDGSIGEGEGEAPIGEGEGEGEPADDDDEDIDFEASSRRDDEEADGEAEGCASTRGTPSLALLGALLLVARRRR